MLPAAQFQPTMPMAASTLTFSELLRQHLARAGMPPAELARRLDVAPATVDHWLAGASTPTTRDLVAAIARILSLDGDDRAALQTAADAIAPPFRVPFLRNPSFVGREQDLQDLHAALATGTAVGIRSALFTTAAGLTGMGGIGKTQLAVEYCYRYWDTYPGGVFWLNAAGEDWRGEFADLGAYLAPDLAGEPDVRRIRAAADYLNAHPDLLLVLDNVADPASLRRPVTSDLIPANLRCRILLTTRSANSATCTQLR